MAENPVSLEALDAVRQVMENTIQFLAGLPAEERERIFEFYREKDAAGVESAAQEGV